MGNVLVADHDVTARHVIELTLRLAGFSVQGVDAVDDVRRALSTGAHDVVVFDPGLDGDAGLDSLRSMRAETGSTARVLVVSGRRQNGAAARALRAGADDYIAKPFSRHELVARLQRLTQN